MALLSPGALVSLNDESLYIPSPGNTVPLFFIATAANKPTPDLLGTAEGTTESGVIRTITSATQLAELYGLPTFKDTAGIIDDGHFLNEYGLQSVFSFLTAANFCYVIRADIDLSIVPESDVGFKSVVTALNAELLSTTNGVRHESIEYNIALAPGFGYSNWFGVTAGYPTGVDATVATNLIQLSNDLKNEVFVLYDGPHNQTSTEFATEALSFPKSPFAAVSYPGGMTSNVDGQTVWVPASGVHLRVITQSDNQAEIWFAPMAFRRGNIDNLSSVAYIDNIDITNGSGTPREVMLLEGDRDVLYADGKNINVFAKFFGKGIVVLGQKTQSAVVSSMNRINTARMVSLFKRSIRKASLDYLAQPNDSITRNNLAKSIEGFLGDVLSRRGLEDFAVLSDESNNTPIRRARQELWVDIAIIPLGAVEFIYVDIRVRDPGQGL